MSQTKRNLVHRRKNRHKTLHKRIKPRRTRKTKKVRKQKRSRRKGGRVTFDRFSKSMKNIKVEVKILILI